MNHEPLTDAQLLTKCEALCAAAYMAAHAEGQKDRAEARSQCAAMTAELNALINPPPLVPAPTRYFADEDPL